MTSITELISLLQSLEKKREHNDAAELINNLLSEGERHQQATWAAHMTPAIDPPALLGQLLSGLHSGNLLSAELYPQLAEIESQLISWFCQLFKQPFGHFTHGSSYANLEALWYAREYKQHSSLIVYGSNASHYSIIKACHILGLEFHPIASNSDGQIDIDALNTACQKQAPIAIVATAGTSSCGAVDPLQSCIDIAHRFNSWCHIDAAWGGALALLKNHPDLSGIEQADSLCFDPHKALGLPKPAGVLVYKKALDRFDAIDTDYLTQAPKQTLAGSYGGELFLALWCELLFNQDDLTPKLTQRLQQAKEFALILKEKTNWTVWHSETGIVCFKPNEDDDLSPLEQQGIFSTSKIAGQDVYRAVFASHLSDAKMLFSSLIPYL